MDHTYKDADLRLQLEEVKQVEWQREEEGLVDGPERCVEATFRGQEVNDLGADRSELRKPRNQKLDIRPSQIGQD